MGLDNKLKSGMFVYTAVECHHNLLTSRTVKRVFNRKQTQVVAPNFVPIDCHSFKVAGVRFSTFFIQDLMC